MPTRLPPLNALRAFEASARHRSFSRAAEELNVTPAAISHQIKGLEEYLAAKLFTRAKRTLMLTPAGQSLLPGVRKGFAAFNEAMEGLDAAVTASSMEPPVNMSDMQEVERTYARQARAPFNLIGNPTIAIPTGLHSNGLPLALQIVGRAFDEATCFRVAWAVEQELNVGVQRPPV